MNTKIYEFDAMIEAVPKKEAHIYAFPMISGQNLTKAE